MTTDPVQALWDTEDAAEYRAALRSASESVQEADCNVADCRADWRDAVAALATAQQAVTDWTLTTEPIPPAVFLQRLRVLDGAVAKAEEEVTRSKGELNAARVKRGRLWDERRVKVRRKFERYPLEEYAAKTQTTPDVNEADIGERTPIHAEPVDVTPEGAGIVAAVMDPDDPSGKPRPIVPTDDQCSARLCAEAGYLRVEVGGDFLTVLWDEEKGVFEAEARSRFGNWHTDIELCDTKPSREVVAAAIGEQLGIHCEVESFSQNLKGWPMFTLRRLDRAAPTPTPPAKVETAPRGDPWPGGLTEAALELASVASKLATGGRLTKPVSVQAFEWDGRLWVYIGGDGTSYEVLPLVPLYDFMVRYPGFPTNFQPNLPADATDEDRLQYYTAVVVKVGRRKYAIAPAGEARTITKPTE